jgi:hypothetical protein
MSLVGRCKRRMQESDNIRSNTRAGDFHPEGDRADAACIDYAPVGSPSPRAQSGHDSVRMNHNGQSQQQDDARLETFDLIEQQLSTFGLVARAGVCEVLAHLLVAGLQSDEPIGHVAGFDADLGVGESSSEVPPRCLVIFPTRRMRFSLLVAAKALCG